MDAHHHDHEVRQGPAHNQPGHDQTGHNQNHVHLGEADWESMAAHTELAGEVQLSFVTNTAAWLTQLRDADAPPVRRILDIGSGPGVGACELARNFAGAHVVAVDGSPAMLDRASQRAARQGLRNRVTTHLAELPHGLDGVEPADVIWASMSLHHIGDEVGSLRALRDLLRPHGLIAIAELGDPVRMLPDDLGPGLGRPGLVDRLDRAGSVWFQSMRDGLADSVHSSDLLEMFAAAGLEVVGSRLDREHIGAPLPEDARKVVLANLRRARDHMAEHLDDDDIATLDVLTDIDDPRGVMHRPDVFLSDSRQIVVGRPIGAQ